MATLGDCLVGDGGAWQISCGGVPYGSIGGADVVLSLILLFCGNEEVTALLGVDRYVYIEARKGMYGIPQAGILMQELVERRLDAKGY